MVDPSGLSAVGDWWNASVAGFRSEGPVDAIMRALAGLPVEAGAVGIAGALGGMSKEAAICRVGSDNAANGLKLNKFLASQAQMSEAGTTMAGAGSRAPFRDAARVASEYGGNAAEWVKKTSSSHTAQDAVTFETHWVENINTGQRVEFKTKFPGRD